MVDITKIKVGDKVHFVDSFTKEPQNGLVKGVPKNGFGNVWVVYHCNNDWKNYQNYTAQSTLIEDLYLDWQ